MGKIFENAKGLGMFVTVQPFGFPVTESAIPNRLRRGQILFRPN